MQLLRLLRLCSLRLLWPEQALRSVLLSLLSFLWRSVAVAVLVVITVIGVGVGAVGVVDMCARRLPLDMRLRLHGCRPRHVLSRGLDFSMRCWYRWIFCSRSASSRSPVCVHSAQRGDAHAVCVRCSRCMRAIVSVGKDAYSSLHREIDDRCIREQLFILRVIASWRLQPNEQYSRCPNAT